MVYDRAPIIASSNRRYAIAVNALNRMLELGRPEYVRLP